MTTSYIPATTQWTLQQSEGKFIFTLLDEQYEGDSAFSAVEKGVGDFTNRLAGKTDIIQVLVLSLVFEILKQAEQL